MVFYSRMTIYFNFARYALPIPHYDTILFGNCMLGVLLVTSNEKTIDAVESLFYWPSLKRDVARLIGQCRTYQLAKQRKQNTCLYMPLPVPDRL